MQPQAKPTNRETEHNQTLTYLIHMYETRHQVFQFVVGANTALFALVFQFVTSIMAKSILAIVGGIVTLALTLMARRSLRYLTEVEKYAQELEKELGFNLLSETNARMPKGVDSSVYLIYVYWALVVIWVIAGVYFVVSLFSNLPQL
jgi:hypothetical protein